MSSRIVTRDPLVLLVSLLLNDFVFKMSEGREISAHHTKSPNPPASARPLNTSHTQAQQSSPVGVDTELKERAGEKVAPPPEDAQAKLDQSSVQPVQLQAQLKDVPGVQDDRLIRTGKEDPWSKPLRILEAYDTNICKNWNDEIQNLLIFTSLFAATVTAFAVESYQWLDSDASETSAKLLLQISLQLANMSNPAQFNDMLIQSPLSFASAPLKPYAVGVNALWFLSLSISLSVVLIGVLCLQWLREYQNGSTSISHKDAFALRQLRYEGLYGWKVPQVISLLPFLLQVSVLLFFLGLIYLLWALNLTVAIILMPILILVPSILLITAIAPALQAACARLDHAWPITQCPYKSPQAWWCYRIFRRFRSIGRYYTFRFHHCKSWFDWDVQWMEGLRLDTSDPPHWAVISADPHPSYVASCILWIANNLTHVHGIGTLLDNLLPNLSEGESRALAKSLTCNTPYASEVFWSMQLEEDSLRACVELAVMLRVPNSAWDIGEVPLQHMRHRLERSLKNIDHMSHFFSPTTFNVSSIFQTPLLSASGQVDLTPKVLMLLQRWEKMGPPSSDPEAHRVYKSDLLFSLLTLIKGHVPFTNHATDTSGDAEHIELNPANVAVELEVLNLVQSLTGDLGAVQTGFISSYMVNMYKSTPQALKYKYKDRNAEAWESFKNLVITTDETYRKSFDTSNPLGDINWLIFFGIVTGVWRLQTVWESPDYDIFSTSLSRLSVDDLYPVAVWGLNPPWIHTHQPLVNGDLSKTSIRASVELAVLLRTQSNSLLFLEDDNRKDLVRRIQEFMVEHLALLDSGTFVSIDDVAKVVYGIMLRADDKTDASLLEMDVLKPEYATNFARNLFIRTGFDPAILWHSRTNVATLGEESSHRTFVKILMATIEDASHDDIGMLQRRKFPLRLCMAGLKLLDPCSWIDDDARVRVIESALVILLKSTNFRANVPDPRAVPQLTQDAKHQVEIIHNLIMKHRLEELSAKYPAWGNLSSMVLTSYDSCSPN